MKELISIASNQVAVVKEDVWTVGRELIIIVGENDYVCRDGDVVKTPAISHYRFCASTDNLREMAKLFLEMAENDENTSYP